MKTCTLLDEAATWPHNMDKLPLDIKLVAWVVHLANVEVARCQDG